MTSAKKGTITQYDAHVERTDRESKKNMKKIDLSVVNVPSKIVSAHKSKVQPIVLNVEK